jgi:tRNA (adenine57-N1/adenine58-N1)-methyltransferase
LQAGEWVRITDAKGRRHNVRLEAGKEFSTKKGQLKHDDMIGQPEGTVLVSSLGGQYQVFRPLLSEYVVSMPRGAAIVYPKDAAHIVTMADIFPGARVVEAGVGSGALTLYLLRAVGPDGRVGSYEVREDFAEIARRNVEQIAGSAAPWTLTVGDVREVIVENEIDRLILDMVDPWTCVPLAVERLVPGGIVCAYVATTTQLSLFASDGARAWGLGEDPAPGAGRLRTGLHRPPSPRGLAGVLVFSVPPRGPAHPDSDVFHGQWSICPTSLRVLAGRLVPLVPGGES